MHKIILLCFLSLNISLFCSDSKSNQITAHHRRVASYTLQLQTTDSGRIALRALGRARFTLIAQACTDYITGLALYNSNKLTDYDRQKLTQALERTKQNIASDEKAREQLFQVAQHLVKAHIEALPELQPYAQAIKLEQEGLVGLMTDDEQQQYNRMWSDFNQEFKEVYYTTLQKGLSQAQLTLQEDCSQDCTIS